MKESTFDLLLRRAAQQATRRAMLGVLIGGALLLNDRGEIEATKRAKRRKRRKRREPHTAKRGILIRVDNTEGTGTWRTEAGEVTGAWCCRPHVHRFLIRPGEYRDFDTDRDGGWIWLDTGRPAERYWFQFNNPLGFFDVRPWASIALGGTLPNNNLTCCAYPVGRWVEIKRLMSQGDTRTYAIDDAVFTVRRHSDTAKGRRFFTVTPPKILPPPSS